jgi:hypothetical protein
MMGDNLPRRESTDALSAVVIAAFVHDLERLVQMLNRKVGPDASLKAVVEAGFWFPNRGCD